MKIGDKKRISVDELGFVKTFRGTITEITPDFLTMDDRFVGELIINMKNIIIIEVWNGE